MTTGASLFLVSACATAEDFVAAFRRYADRTGLFIPIAEPFAVGKRVWLALTLKDGGIMVEGVAEVIASSSKPSALHGRTGMTIRFVEPDAPSKTVLAELEKARLAMKPPPLSMPPRVARSPVPAEPRPTPPAPGGRIDAANALAECVAVGDTAGLRDAAKTGEHTAIPKAGPKFVVPAIPGSAARPKAPTTPPEPKPTTLGVAPLGKPRVLATQPVSVVPPPRPGGTQPPSFVPAVTAPGVGPVGPGAPITTPGTGISAVTPAMFPNAAPNVTPTTITAPPPPPMTGELQAPKLDGEVLIANKPPREDPKPEPRRGKPGTAPPRRPTPATPLPATVAELDSGEKTDLGTPPSPPDTIRDGEAPTLRARSMRASEIMAAIPDDDWTMTPDQSQPTVLPPSEKPTVVEATTPMKGPPTGDWTMTTDGDGGWSEPAKVERPASVPAPTSGPTSGNVVAPVASEKSVQAWEDKPTSLGPKIEIDPTLMEGPIVISEAAGAPPMPDNGPVTTPPIEAILPQTPVPYPGGVQPLARPVLPQNMWPAQPGTMQRPLPGVPPPHVPIQPGIAYPPPPVPNAQASGSNPVYPAQPPQGFPPPPARTDPTDGGTGFFWDTGAQPRYPTDALNAIDDKQRKRRMMFIIGGAGVFVVMLVVVIVLASTKKTRTQQPPAPPPRGSAAAASGSGSAAIPAVGSADVGSAGSGSATPMVEPAGSGSAGSGSAAPATCSVELTTTPAGAEVVIHDTNVLGTTPGTFPLPCGTETKLVIRKQRYTNVTKAVTPAGENEKVAVRLSHVAYQIKVTSSPAGATITVAGKVVGVTPTTIKLPAFETSTITLTKDGFAADTERVTPKQNNMAHHATLKKGHR